MIRTLAVRTVGGAAAQRKGCQTAVKAFSSAISKAYVRQATRISPAALLTASAVFMGVGVVGVVSSHDSLRAAAKAISPEIQAVKDDIVKVIEAEDAKRNDGTGLAPTLIRLAWHASGTYCAKTNTGGSNGSTMRMDPESGWGANAGLAVARSALEPIKEKYPNMSYADIWTLAGAVAIEQMGGPEISWRKGRTDSPTPTTVPDGRLPDADKGAPKDDVAHVRAIFNRMGFNDREMVALIGAHAVGRCHENASGYWGPWTRAETTFSNEYFRLLVEEKWTLKTTHKGKPWTGPEQFEDPTGQLMMLPADMALIWDKGFRTIVEEYAVNEEVFFADFAKAFSKLIELGVPGTAAQAPAAATGGFTAAINSLKRLFGMAA